MGKANRKKKIKVDKTLKNKLAVENQETLPEFSFETLKTTYEQLGTVLIQVSNLVMSMFNRAKEEIMSKNDKTLISQYNGFALTIKDLSEKLKEVSDKHRDESGVFKQGKAKTQKDLDIIIDVTFAYNDINATISNIAYGDIPGTDYNIISELKKYESNKDINITDEDINARRAESFKQSVDMLKTMTK